MQDKSRDWYETPSGDARGYIMPQGLRELWLHTGTLCNLSCSFCLEGAGPGNSRVESLSFGEARPYLDSATDMGVERFSFTGGEPFMNKEFPAILAYAANLRPCLTLTNGTGPLSRALAQIAPLARAPHAVSFRISLDHPEAERHDAHRGKGTFVKAVRSLAALYTMGFGVSVARHAAPGEDAASVNRRYGDLFDSLGLPRTLAIVPFPDFGRPNSAHDVPHITTDCMTRYHSEASRSGFMCAFSNMVLKKAGRMRVYPCTLVDDDDEYDLGATLGSDAPVSMKHHRCYSCFSLGASCSEG